MISPKSNAGIENTDRAVRWTVRAALALALSLALAYALKPAGVRLRDSTYLRLMATTVGPGHRFSSGEQFERRPFTWLPASFRDRMGWKQFAVNVQVADEDSLLVWFNTYSPAAKSAMPHTFTRVELLNGDGETISVGAQSNIQLPSQRAGLLLFPGITNIPAGSRIRFRYGPPPGYMTEVRPPNLRQ